MPLLIETCSVYQIRVFDVNGSTRSMEPELFERKSCRAFRLVGDSTRFLYVTFSKGMGKGQVASALQDMVDHGVIVTSERPLQVMYKFLGYTESNLKTGQVIFFCEGEDWDCQRLLKAFGNLEEVYLQNGAGTYAARLSLSFSATIDIVAVPPDEALFISDQEALDRASIHTDGCGLIRESFAAAIRKQISVNSSTCVFQIRYGGMKGILVSYADEDFENICGHIRARMNSPFENPRQYKIAYRPSMRKYDMGSANLEVHACSYPPSAATLNFAFIILLLSLGVPIESFKTLCDDHMKFINSIMDDRDAALKCFKGELDAEGEAFMQDGYEMLLAGFDLKEPQLYMRLSSLRKGVLRNLRKKFNIKVKKSCYLFGVIDELKVLGEDEVYINLPDRDGVCISEVIVARAPSYFPSDIRVYRAVNKKRLSFLTNCIVFSRRSVHSMPDSLSGGDLDGDMYFVSWDQTIIPRRIQEPRARIPPARVERPAQSSVRDIKMLEASLISTFLNMRHLSVVGILANEWMRAVEQSNDLANGEYPLLLAEQAEAALDLLKTGADPEVLLNNFRNLKKTNNSNYSGMPSPMSPLESLRRLVPDVTDFPDRPTEYRTDPDLSLRDEGGMDYEHFYSEGRELMLKFNSELRDAIVMDEEGQALDRNGDAKLHSFYQSHLESHADRLKRHYVTKYFPAGSLIDSVTRRCFIRASAWYHVGYAAHKPAFAWLGRRYLCHLKAAATNQNKPGLVVGALRGL